MKPSAKRVLEALQRGEELTIQRSISLLGVSALSQRITELRRDGYDIRDRFGTVKGERKPFKVYWMAVPKQPAPRTETVVREHVRRLNVIEDEPVEQQGVLFA